MLFFKERISELMGNLNPSINNEALFTGLGYEKDTIPLEAEKKVQELLNLAKECLKPGFIMEEAAVTHFDKEKIVSNALVVKSEKWALACSKMQGPRIAHAFVLTLGPMLDELILEKGRESIFDAYVLDAIGSLCIENMAGVLEKEIRNLAKKQSRQISRRFSPGYCDWDLAAGQEVLRGFLAPKRIGVQFFEIGAMKPAKTISGLVLSADQVLMASPCSHCGQKKCSHRRVQGDR